MNGLMENILIFVFFFFGVMATSALEVMHLFIKKLNIRPGIKLQGFSFILSLQPNLSLAVCEHDHGLKA